MLHLVVQTFTPLNARPKCTVKIWALCDYPSIKVAGFKQMAWVLQVCEIWQPSLALPPVL